MADKYVYNLQDDITIPGTLRYEMANADENDVIWIVANGVIYLKSILLIPSNITVDGSKSFNQISTDASYNSVGLATGASASSSQKENITLRHLRIRPGKDTNILDVDGLFLPNVNNLTIQNCSISFWRDEALGFVNSSNVIVSDCIISYGLNFNFIQNTIDENFIFRRNIIAYSASRGYKGAITEPSISYNNFWFMCDSTHRIQETQTTNIINNRMITNSPMTTQTLIFIPDIAGQTLNVYLEGNKLQRITPAADVEDTALAQNGGIINLLAEPTLEPDDIMLTDDVEAYCIANAGARYVYTGELDDFDNGLIDNINSRTDVNITSMTDIGGLPLQTYSLPVDTSLVVKPKSRTFSV